MSVIRFNAENTRLPIGSRMMNPGITIRGNGVFRLNRELMALLKAKVGSTVEFLHDPANNEWYIGVVPGGIPLREGPNGAGLFQSVVLRAALDKSLESKGETLCLPVAKEGTDVDGVKCYAMLTSARK